MRSREQGGDLVLVSDDGRFQVAALLGSEGNGRSTWAVEPGLRREPDHLEVALSGPRLPLFATERDARVTARALVAAYELGVATWEG